VLLLFCVVGLHEWWLIATKQIAVIPAPAAGSDSAPEVPAASLLPWIVGSGVLAATFAYAGVRGSVRALVGGYAALRLVLGLAAFRQLL